jgi:hypothetical protein
MREDIPTEERYTSNYLMCVRIDQSLCIFPGDELVIIYARCPSFSYNAQSLSLRWLSGYYSVTPLISFHAILYSHPVQRHTMTIVEFAAPYFRHMSTRWQSHGQCQRSNDIAGLP